MQDSMNNLNTNFLNEELNNLDSKIMTLEDYIRNDSYIIKDKKNLEINLSNFKKNISLLKKYIVDKDKTTTEYNYQKKMDHKLEVINDLINSLIDSNSNHDENYNLINQEMYNLKNDIEAYIKNTDINFEKTLKLQQDFKLLDEKIMYIDNKYNQINYKLDTNNNKILDIINKIKIKTDQKDINDQYTKDNINKINNKHNQIEFKLSDLEIALADIKKKQCEQNEINTQMLNCISNINLDLRDKQNTISTLSNNNDNLNNEVDNLNISLTSTKEQLKNQFDQSINQIHNKVNQVCLKNRDHEIKLKNFDKDLKNTEKDIEFIHSKLNNINSKNCQTNLNEKFFQELNNRVCNLEKKINSQDSDYNLHEQLNHLKNRIEMVYYNFRHHSHAYYRTKDNKVRFVAIKPK